MQGLDRPGQTMRILFFLGLAAVPLLEIALLVHLGQWLGFWQTMGLVVATALVGTFVIHRQGYTVLARTMAAVNDGKPPIAPVVDGAFVLLAGVLLILPGLITDVIGLLLLVPWVRHRVAAGSVRSVLRSSVFKAAADPRAHPRSPGTNGARAPEDGPVIEGEFERIDERSVDRTKRPNGSTHR
jgi:UPF0716 protein FxsA